MTSANTNTLDLREPPPSKLLDARDEDLREILVSGLMDSSSETDMSDNAVRNARLAKILWTLVHESGPGAFDQAEQRAIEVAFPVKFNGKKLPSVRVYIYIYRMT